MAPQDHNRKLVISHDGPHVLVLESKEGMSSICKTPHLALLLGTGKCELASHLDPHSQDGEPQCNILQTCLEGEQEEDK